MTETTTETENNSQQPKLIKVQEVINPENPTIKYYIYKKHFINKHGEDQLSTIRVKYSKTQHQNSRDVITTEIINEIKDREYPNIQAAMNDYVNIIHEKHPTIKPYTYNAFSKRWKQ